jgi:D-alanine-D-alanine ligase-like ATP-grasp enzyme
VSAAAPNMRICVLHPSYGQSSSVMKDLDPDCDPSRFLPQHSWHNERLHKGTAVRQLAKLRQQGFDVFVNLCDGAWDEDRAGIEVVQTLERFNLAFTGAGSAFYEPSRLEMKLAAAYAGVRVPAFAFVDRPGDLSRALALRFPLIVKHPASYSSIGLEPDSRVTDRAGLERQVARMLEQFGGALVEEFIDGREFTVLVTEPRDTEGPAWTLRPMECGLGAPENFKHFDLKWIHYDQIQWTAVSDDALAQRLMAQTAAVFTEMSGSGYARVDFRMDASGVLYFLEINPQCGIFYPEGSYGSADDILAVDPVGHAGFLAHLLECALRRQAARRPRHTVVLQAEGGFGLVAARDFAEGEVVDWLEERPQALVSRSHVERTWRGIKRRWFDQYAFPISDRVFGMWIDKPLEWRPYDHSCAPNAWLDGLNVVARRPIAAGELLTLDYATFCGPDMEPFSCRCGASECRGTVTQWDHLTAAVDRYGAHVSDYVGHARERMRRLGLEASRSGPSGGFALRSTVARKVGEVLCDFDCIPAPRSRHTVQVSADQHAEIVPGFLRLCSHSCRPNVVYDVDTRRIGVLADVQPGDELTFFYPATEWDMAAPFECSCGAPGCLGRIAGARHIPRDVLRGYWLARHIRELSGQATRA